jgi:dolichol-phosphate mannosyltransferase
VIVPMLNEEDTVEKFCETIVPVMEGMHENFEIILVNDGSRDTTQARAEKICESDKRIKLINFSKNFKPQSVFLCGFKHASGEAVAIIDVDLQHPPSALVEMFKKHDEGFDIVHGRRHARRTGLFMRVPSFFFNRFLRKITHLNIPKGTTDFKVFDKKVVSALLNMPEHNRFLRSQTEWIGFSQTIVDYHEQSRTAGKTKWTFKKLVRLASDGIISNSNYLLTLPLRLGLLFAFLSCAAYATFVALVFFNILLPVWAWFIPGVVIGFSVMAIFMGFTNLYIERIYDEVKNRPQYIIKSKVNFEN